MTADNLGPRRGGREEKEEDVVRQRPLLGSLGKASRRRGVYIHSCCVAHRNAHGDYNALISHEAGVCFCIQNVH